MMINYDLNESNLPYERFMKYFKYQGNNKIKQTLESEPEEFKFGDTDVNENIGINSLNQSHIKSNSLLLNHNSANQDKDKLVKK